MRVEGSGEMGRLAGTLVDDVNERYWRYENKESRYVGS